MAVPAVTGSILRGAGKAAWWATKPVRAAGSAAGRGVMAGNKGAIGAVMGASVAAGVGSAVMDREGPYADLQEHNFGDRDAIRYSMQAGLKTAFDPANEHDINRPLDYYYGRPVNVPGIARRRASGGTTPVPGDVVFGMHNMRKG